MDVELERLENGLVSGTYRGLTHVMDPRDGRVLYADDHTGGWDTDDYLFVSGKIESAILSGYNPALQRKHLDETYLRAQRELYGNWMGAQAAGAQTKEYGMEVETPFGSHPRRMPAVWLLLALGIFVLMAAFLLLSHG